MATSKEDLVRKRYESEERKIQRLIDRYRTKYGRNWTKAHLTAKEHQAFIYALRSHLKTVDALYSLQTKVGIRSKESRIKRPRKVR